jgi:hypothetical protein
MFVNDQISATWHGRVPRLEHQASRQAVLNDELMRARHGAFASAAKLDGFLSEFLPITHRQMIWRHFKEPKRDNAWKLGCAAKMLVIRYDAHGEMQWIGVSGDRNKTARASLAS